MTKQLKWLLTVLGVLVVLFLFNQLSQQKHTARRSDLFKAAKEDIYGIEVYQQNDSLRLIFDGNQWHIDGHDSLQVKATIMDNFFNRVLKTKKASLVSRNREKWDKFNVSDSLGTRLRLLDADNTVLEQVVIGRSTADWSVNNLREMGKDEVYQTDQNILYQLQTRPNYWGEVPPPPESDSTTIDSM
ncbi:MAG: hypothetical protein ACE5D2_05435 [Fidelibacterota bacterium]